MAGSESAKVAAVKKKTTRQTPKKAHKTQNRHCEHGRLSWRKDVLCAESSINQSKHRKEPKTSPYRKTCERSNKTLSGNHAPVSRTGIKNQMSETFLKTRLVESCSTYNTVHGNKVPVNTWDLRVDQQGFEPLEIKAHWIMHHDLCAAMIERNEVLHQPQYPAGPRVRLKTVEKGNGLRQKKSCINTNRCLSRQQELMGSKPEKEIQLDATKKSFIVKRATEPLGDQH